MPIKKNILLILLIIVVVIFGVSSWQIAKNRDSNIDLENETDNTKSSVESIAVDNFNFDYDTDKKIITFKGEVPLSNGCLSVGEYELFDNSTPNIPNFILNITVKDAGGPGIMCTQIFTNKKISGQKAVNFEERFGIENFNKDIFTIQIETRQIQ